MAKYRAYVEFGSVAVWDDRPGERARLEHYLSKCMDTALVAMSPDFVPSQAFYSAHLLDASTFSFQPSHDSLQTYQQYQLPTLPETPAPIALVDPGDFPLLFVEASRSKWGDDDPHPVPRRF